MLGTQTVSSQEHRLKVTRRTSEIEWATTQTLFFYWSPYSTRTLLQKCSSCSLAIATLKSQLQLHLNKHMEN